MSTEATAKAIDRQAQEFAEAWGVDYALTGPLDVTNDDTSVAHARAVLCQLAGRDVCVGLDDTYNVEVEQDVFVALPNYLLPSAFTPDAPRPWDRLGRLAAHPEAHGTILEDINAGIAAIVEASQENHPPTHVVSPTELREAEEQLAASSPPPVSRKARKRARAKAAKAPVGTPEA